MQEFDALGRRFQAVGARVRAVVCQHGDIPAMLARRGCDLQFVELISDPDFSLCQDYEAKGIPLIKAVEERDKLLESLVKNDGFESKDAAKHNMVQPALCIEDGDGNVVFRWSWHDVGIVGQFWTEDGLQSDDTFAAIDGVSDNSHDRSDLDAGTHTHIVALRPTTDSILTALQAGSFDHIQTDVYPKEWKRPKFPFSHDGAALAAL
jgi:hypothetical protein